MRTRLAALEKELQDLKDVRDSKPPSEVTQEERDAIEVKEQEVADAKVDITNLVTSIESDIESISYEEAYVDTLTGKIEDLMSDYRRAQRELEDLRTNYQEALSEFQNIANQLEDIEGSADPSEATVDANVSDADGAEGSRLALTVEASERMTNVNAQYTYLRDSLNDAKVVRKTALDAANRKKVTADREVASAEEDLARLRRDLAVLIANQGNIEVEAAASLLEDFLKNGSLVLSAAATVDISVERDIAKTCEDSKVRSLVSRIRAAYLDEDEYKALRAEFRADPVGSFFNTINDPCFALLSEDEVEALRADIKANFSRRAAALFAKYFPTRSGSTSSSSRTGLIVVGVLVVVVILAALFWFMKSR
jgi:DNA repair exonuclease SbcCD ATPase subunit